MFRRARAMWGLLLLAGGALAFVVPSALSAQSEDGFLFRRPKVTLGFNGGYAIPQAGSDLFDDITQRHTLEQSDFHAPVFMGSLGFRVSERFDLAFEVGYASSKTLSEYREWVDQDDLPIEQTTELRRVPLTVSLKAYLWERGRQVSRFAWIPNRWSPYVGAGAGWVNYEFSQRGDFINFQDLGIYTDEITTDGTTGTFHVLAGAEVSLTPRFVLTGEGRYSWAETGLDHTFGNYDEPIDLSGFQATMGIAVRF